MNFHALPKTDHHHHLFLGGRRQRIETLFGVSLLDFTDFRPEICRNRGKTPSAAAIGRISEWIRQEYFPICAHENFLEFAVRAALEAAAEDNVRRLETSVNLTFPAFFQLSAFDFLTRLRNVHQEAAPEMKFFLDLGISRTEPADTQFAWFQEFLDVKPDFDSPRFGISGIDLYDVEDTARDADFRGFFTLAGHHGLKRKAHIGEFSPAESVPAAVEMLELDEIQHGVHAGDSPEIARRLARQKTRVNISPASNEILDAIDFSRNPHPLRVLYDAGVNFSLATDDLMLFGKTITDQAISLVEQGVFTAEEVAGMIRPI